MSVRIRLRRLGAKKKPFYRIVVADQRTARDGRFIEQLGYYDPTTEPPTMKIDAENAKKWLGHGAQPSEVVTMLLRRAGILENKKQQVEDKPQLSKKARKKAAEAEVAAPVAAATEAPVEAAAETPAE